MDTIELQKLAEHTRTKREMSVGLLIGTAILAACLFIPTGPREAPVAVVEPPAGPNAFAHVPLDAKAAIVYDLATGKTLYAMNADAQLPLASLTKLLTVYTAVSTLATSTPVTISDAASRLEAPHAFAAGQTFLLADLARLTLTASLNDGAAAILEAVGEHEHQTPADALAGAAAALSLSQTYAVNGSGLDVSPTLSGGYGSARDIAVLAGALAERIPSVADATTERVSTARALDGRVYTVTNTDPIVDSVPHLLLSKTGYTDLADGNLALVFDVGIQHPVAVVVLGSSKQARFTDGSALVAATLAHFAGVASL